MWSAHFVYNSKRSRTSAYISKRSKKSGCNSKRFETFSVQF